MRDAPGGRRLTWAQNLYALHRGSLGGILPDAVARLTKGQMAVLCNEGDVGFGGKEPPGKLPEPPRRPGSPPARPRPRRR